MSQPTSHQAPHLAPPITLALRKKGPKTLGHETNLARAPMWAVEDRPMQGDLLAPSILYGRPFRIAAGRRPTTADQRLYAELTTVFVREGCPEHRRVPFSLGWAARLLGHENGGRQRQLVRRSLARLRSLTLECAVRDLSGETVLGFGLLDRYLTTETGGGQGWAVLSEEIAHLLKQGSVTYLNGPVWDAIRADDELAGLLWTFLEAERIGSGFNYQLFAAPPGAIDDQRNMPAIAEVLGIADWTRRRDVARRVTEAITALARHDPRYQLALANSKRPGMWRLEVSRRRLATTPSAALPSALIAAWRRAYHGRRPSSRQLDVLQDLEKQHGAEVLVQWLSEGAADPFRHLLDAGAQARRHRDVELDKRDREWAAKKAQAKEDAPQLLGDIIKGMSERGLQT